MKSTKTICAAGMTALLFTVTFCPQSEASSRFRGRQSRRPNPACYSLCPPSPSVCSPYCMQSKVPMHALLGGATEAECAGNPGYAWAKCVNRRYVPASGEPGYCILGELMYTSCNLPPPPPAFQRAPAEPRYRAICGKFFIHGKWVCLWRPALWWEKAEIFLPQHLFFTPCISPRCHPCVSPARNAHGHSSPAHRAVRRGR
jgi:hypothetical protein